MFVYLVQHAEAKREEEDRIRPLSETGFKDITRVASYASRLNININEILCSPKLRANQTAQVLADHLKPLKGPLETDGLAPLDEPSIWAERLRVMTDNSMLVGHLPHLDKLASLLLCGDADKNVVSFKTAGVVCLIRNENMTWSLQWMITPEIIV